MSSDGIFKGPTGDSEHGTSGPGHGEPGRYDDLTTNEFPGIGPDRTRGWTINYNRPEDKDRAVKIHALNPKNNFCYPDLNQAMFWDEGLKNGLKKA